MASSDRPSGVHVENPNIDCCPALIAVTFIVATSTTWTCERSTRSGSRPRSEVNAIRRPSGDHDGWVSATGPSVRRLATPVAASTSHRWSIRS